MDCSLARYTRRLAHVGCFHYLMSISPSAPRCSTEQTDWTSQQEAWRVLWRMAKKTSQCPQKPNRFPSLETARLLRAFTPEDAAAVFAIMADPEVMRYFGSPPMPVLDQAAQRIAGINQAFAEQEGVRWAIVWREDGTFIGSCGFGRLVTPHFRAELGYELGRPWWGQGLMPGLDQSPCVPVMLSAAKHLSRT